MCEECKRREPSENIQTVFWGTYFVQLIIKDDDDDEEDDVADSLGS